MGKFGGGGKKPHLAEKKKRERFKQLHPEGRKVFSLNNKKKRLEKQLEVINKKLNLLIK